MKEKFISTTDKATADKLISIGFKMIQNYGDSYLFLNTPSIKFNSDVNMSKIRYTNLISI